MAHPGGVTVQQSLCHEVVAPAGHVGPEVVGKERVMCRAQVPVSARVEFEHLYII